MFNTYTTIFAIFPMVGNLLTTSFATGPFISEPLGSFFSLTSTAALSSNLIVVPSGLFISFL